MAQTERQTRPKKATDNCSEQYAFPPGSAIAIPVKACSVRLHLITSKKYRHAHFAEQLSRISNFVRRVVANATQIAISP
jgi:hypothetical protein